MTTYLEALSKMDQCMKLLRLELPAKVHDDAMAKWRKLKHEIDRDHEFNCCGKTLAMCIYSRGNQ